jgi:hypothetical protein
VTQTEYDRVTEELMALAHGIETGKRPGYTIGAEDVLANFKRTAERAGIEVGQAWAVFFLKHVDAILSIMTRPDLPQAEEPPGRFADAINYLRLGFAILSERPKSSVADAGTSADSRPAAATPTCGTASAGQASTKRLICAAIAGTAK